MKKMTKPIGDVSTHAGQTNSQPVVTDKHSALAALAARHTAASATDRNAAITSAAQYAPDEANVATDNDTSNCDPFDSMG